MKNIWGYEANSDLEAVYLCRAMLEKKAPKMCPHEVLLQKIDCLNFLKWIVFYPKHHQHFLVKKRGYSLCNSKQSSGSQMNNGFLDCELFMCLLGEEIYCRRG